MDVRLSDEQQVLRASAARVVDRFGPKTVADLDDGVRTDELRAAVTASGWWDLRRSDAGNAPTGTGVEVAIVAEELGRGLADVAFLGPTLAAELLRRAGTETGGRGGAAGGPGAGDGNRDAAADETVLLDRTLSSVVTVVPGAAVTGVAVDGAAARSALVLLDADGSDATRLGRVALRTSSPGPPLDLTRGAVVPTCDSHAERVEAVGMLEEEDVTAWLALGLAVTAADLVGVMRGALKLASDYASVRCQYGAPIGSFQAVAHLLADAHVATEGSRSVGLHAAWAVDALPAEEALAAAALAKAYCSRAAREVCETVVQVHGGIGNTWNCLAHVYLRRALLSTELFGGDDVNLGRVLAHRAIAATAGSGHGFR